MKKQKVILPFIVLVIFIVMSIFVTYDGVHIARKNILGLFKDAKFARELLTDKDKDEDKLLTGMGTARGLIWKYGLKFFLKKPIFGYGPDNLESEYLAENIEQDRPHNLVIQLLTTSGIVGFLLYAGAVGIIVIRGLKRMNSTSTVQKIMFFTIIAYLMSAMFGNSTILTSPYFFIFLGFLMCENEKIENKKGE